jgi:uracil-DNA glycosylase
MMRYVEAVGDLKRCHNCGWGDLPIFASRVVEIAGKIDREVEAGRAVFPPPDQVFQALLMTPLREVKAVILGQDPYPTRGNAHGLAFSVPPHRPVPASLKTIFRALAEDCGVAQPQCGDLRPWAKRGVLLLNTVLTVREGEPHSHQKIGWTEVSKAIVKAISDRREPVVFLLWGGPAQRFLPLIDQARHGIVCCAHPSPLNVQKGGRHPFIDAHPFRQANAYLAANGLEPIDWRL